MPFMMFGYQEVYKDADRWVRVVSPDKQIYAGVYFSRVHSSLYTKNNPRMVKLKKLAHSSDPLKGEQVFFFHRPVAIVQM